jgi:hypothetical protein
MVRKRNSMNWLKTTTLMVSTIVAPSLATNSVADS